MECIHGAYAHQWFLAHSLSRKSPSLFVKVASVTKHGVYYSIYHRTMGVSQLKQCMYHRIGPRVSTGEGMGVWGLDDRIELVQEMMHG